MEPKCASLPFDLEALEPRVLLSAVQGLLPATGISCEPSPAAPAIAEQSAAVPAQLNSAVGYDGAAEIDDIFSGLTSEAAPSDVTTDTPADQAPAPEAGTAEGTTGQVRDVLPDAIPPLVVEAGENQPQLSEARTADSPAQRLTETLRAANGPPASDSSEAPSAGSSNTGHYLGVRLNGVPFDGAGDLSGTGEALQIGTTDVLSGSGVFAGPLVVSGTISPGNSPGLLQTGAQTWLAGGFPYDWEINDVAGGEGTNPGWDFQKVAGSLTIISTSATKATVRIKSLQLSNAPGNVFNFNPANAYAWRLLTTSQGISGFSRDVINLDTTGFTNSLGTGRFALDLSADGRDLILRFLPTLPDLSLAQPVWISQGPGYITGNDNSILPPENPASGAVQSLAVHPTNPAIAWLGAVNGGVWMTTTFNWSTTNGINDDGLGLTDDAAETPLWTPLGQDLPSLGVAGLAVSPFDRFGAVVTNATPLNWLVLYVGTGSLSSADEGGAADGLFRSLDGGATWAEIGNFDGLRPTSIVPSSQAAGLLLVGTYDLEPTSGATAGRGGVYRSFDRGDNWDRLSGQGGLPEFHVSDIVQEPGNPGRFYVALAGDREGLNSADIGIYRTDNAQSLLATWTSVVSGIAPDYDHDGIYNESQLKEDLNLNNVLDPGELDFNGDALPTTYGVAETLNNAMRIRLVVSQAVGNPVYAAVLGWWDGDRARDRSLAGVFRSTNAGASWTRLGAEPRTNTIGQGGFHFAMAVDLADTVYVAGDASDEAPYDGLVFRWDAGTWNRVSAKKLIDPGIYKTAPHSDIRNMLFDAGNNSLTVVTDGGLYRLRSPGIGGGVKWEFSGRGVSAAEISSVAYDRNTNTLFAGLQDNGVLAQRPGLTDWYGLLGGDGNTVGVAYINPLAPTSSMRFYLGNNFQDFKRATFNSLDFSLGATPILLKALNDPTSYTGLDNRWRLGSDPTDRAFDGFQHLPFALNAVDDLSDGNIKLLMGRLGLYTSDDNGDHITLVPGWERIFPLQHGYVSAVSYGGRLAGSNDPNIIYASTPGDIWVSSDNGGKFQGVSPKEAGEIHQISVDPENWRTAFAVDDKHVWLVTVDVNGVPSVTDVTGTLGDITHGFASVKVANLGGRLVVLVGASDGVYRLGVGDVGGLAANPGSYALWSRLGVGLPNVQVSDLQFDTIDNVLVAGTLGRGAWTINNAAAALLAEPVLRFEADAGNQQVRLVLSTATAAAPRGLEFYLGGSLLATYPLTNILKISVHLGQGTDSLIVDSAEGPVAVPGGIEFDGGLGVDTLDFQGPASSVIEGAVLGGAQIRQIGREKVVATAVETFLDSTVQQTLLSATRTSFQFISDWFSRLKNLGNIPLLGGSLGAGLGGGQFRSAEGLEDKERGGLEGEGEPFGGKPASIGSLLTRLLQEGPGGFRISDIGSVIASTVNLQSLLDSLDNIPGNVTVTGSVITLGDPTDPNKPFKRTLSFHAPIHASLLDGQIELHGTFELSAEIDLMMEMGVDARGFYVRTNATAQPEITIRNLAVQGEVSASGAFGIMAVDLKEATLTLDPDVAILIDLVEPVDPYGHPADGQLRLYEFGNDPASLVSISVVGDPLQDDLRLDGQFTLALAQAAGAPFLNLGTINLALIWEDINNLGSLRVDASASPAADILMRFLNMDREQLLGEFERLLNALDQLGSSSLLDVKVPFGSGVKLRDAFDFSEAVLNRVYNKLVDVNLTGSTRTNVGNISQGRINANANFNLIIDGVTSILITVTQASTNTNNSLSDLADDINAALPPAVAAQVRAESFWGNIRFRLLGTPTPASSVKVTSTDPNCPLFTQLGFGNNQGGTQKLSVPTLQSLMSRLQELFPSLNLNLNLNQITKRLSWDLQFTHTVPGELMPFAYDTSLSLGNLVEAGFSGTLSMNGALGLTLTLGLDLGAAKAPQLVGSFLVPPPANGHLTKDSNFTINLNDGTRYAISVPAALTAGFTQLSQLVALLNNQLLAYTFNPGTGPIPLNRAIRFIQSRNPDNSLATGIRLEAINEDRNPNGLLDVNEDTNANGRLDPGEDVNGDRHLDINEDKVYQNVDPVFVNGTLDSMLNKIRSLTIEADQDDPIYNEVGFGGIARATLKGLFVDNTTLTANGSILATGLAANARLALFGLATSGGTATGAINTVFNLVNPTGGTRISLTQLLGDLAHLGDYIGISPVWNASLDIRLKNLVVTPNIFPGLIPAGAEVRLFIPDLHHVTFNPNPYHPLTNKQGLFVTYPEFGPLLNFNCLSATDLIIALKSLSGELTQFKGFDFLNRPLPLINISISRVMDFAANFAQGIQGLASGSGQTLDLIEASLESLLGIPSNDLTFSVEYTAQQTLVTGSAGVAAEYLFNPTGQNNALHFTSVAATGGSYNLVTFNFADEGAFAPGADVALVDNYDPATKTVTIHYNASYTTAATIRAAVHAKYLANPVTMPFDATLDAIDAGNNGSGTVHQTALRMELGYHVAYANSLPFAFGLGDLVNLLPLSSPVRTLLAGVADFVTVEGSGNLNVTAAADLKLVLGLDVSSPCRWKPFFYDSDYNGPNTGTGINLTARMTATNLVFTAGLGGINVSVNGGSATFDSDGLSGSPGGDQDASFTVTLKDGNGDGRHYLRSSETFFDSANIGVTVTAGASAVLPLYVVVGSVPIPLGSSADADGDGYPDNDLVVLIPSFKRLFFPEKTNASFQATITSPGANNDLIFMGPGPGLEVKIININGAPLAALSGTRLEVNLNSLITTGTTVTGLTLPGGWSVILSPTDPGNTGGGAVYADLTILTPNLANLFTGFNPCDLVKNAPMLLDGLDGLLGTIQNGLANNVLNKTLPLVGNKLGDAADFIQKFRGGLLARIRAQLIQAGDPISLVKQAIFKSLGKDGLDLLVKTDGSPVNTAEDIEIECSTTAINFSVRLKKTLALVDTSAHPIGFDIGIPGLGLSVNGNVKVQLGFDLKLYFGISASDGFYFNTADAEELRVEFKVTIPGLHAKGSLLFLQLDVGDDTDDPSSFTGYFSVDIRGPPSHPDKLKFSDFNSSTFNLGDAFDAQLGAVADVNLDLAVSFQGNAIFPRLLAEFNLDWSWDLGGDADGSLKIGFHDIRLDAGAFISKYIKPVLEQVKKVTDPAQPLVDLLTTPIPIISDLAGEPIDMLKLARLFGYLKPGTEEFIRDLATIVTLIGDTSFSDDGSILIPLGEFNLETDALGNVDRKSGDPDPEAQNLSSGTGDSGIKGFLSKLEEMGFKFPFLKISELFKLFRGQPVTLVEYHMPVLEFTFRYTQKVAIYPPLYALFGGEAGVKIDLTFGYDTTGLQKFFSSSDKNVADLADGFFVKDVDDTGKDVPEVVLTGGLFAGAVLSFGVAEVGVKGGLYVEVDFNLNDPDDDGKVRLSELIANAKHDPLCIFDIHGEIFVEFAAFFKLLSFEKEWDFGKFVLFTFDLTCPTPVLADVSGTGVLTLHMGPRAADRVEGDITDGSEIFIVKHIDGLGTTLSGETVEVSFNGIKQTYKGVKRIIADGGDGNDTIDLRGIYSPATVTGGNGSDTIYAGRTGRVAGLNQLAGSIYFGNAGNDRIVGALQKETTIAVDDEFHGGDGNDTLTGNEGNDLLYGDAGNDTVTGNDGDDQIWGGDGADVISGNAGADIIDADKGNDRITGGTGNDVIIAGDGADTVDAGDGNDWVDGGAGADFITAGNGNDWVDAGPGNDRVIGGRGDDQLIGGAHNDFLDGGAGSDILIGDLGTIVGPVPFSATAFPVNITGISGAGNDVIIGGAGVDVLFGVGGNDRIFGGALLTNGQNQVGGSNPSEFFDDADFIDAGAGNDIVFADDAHGTPSTILPGAIISGSAWFDIADVYAVVNNIRDSGENGLAAVSVELHRLDTSLVGTTVTDANGDFTFSGLDAGDYYLVFVLPTGLTYATQDVGPDDTVDSDVNGTGTTGTIHVDEGASDTTHAAGFHGTNPQISIDDASIVEGSNGLSDLVFTVTLSNPSSTLVTVCYDSASGAGVRGADRILDFSSVSGTLTFQPGETTKTILVPIVGDDVYEGDYETFTVALGTPHNSAINPAHAIGTGTIRDDDTAPVVSVVDTRKTEGTPLAFVVRLSNASKFPVSVEYLTSQAVKNDGTLVADGAVAALDYDNTYELIPGLIVFNPGQTEITVNINTVQDALDEYDERMNLHLGLDTTINYASLGRAVGNGIILDDDATPYVQIAPVTQTILEGHAGTTPVALVISLRDPVTNLPTVSGRPVTVSWNTSSGTARVTPTPIGTSGAVDPADVEYGFDRVVFAPQTNSYPGDSFQGITVNILGDTRTEPQVGGLWEYFFVNLLKADNGVLDPQDSGLNHATIFIKDDEVPDPGPWYVQFDRTAYSVKEGQTLTVTLVAAEYSSVPLAVYWSIGGAGLGVATPGVDYPGVWENGTSGARKLVRFAPGQTSLTFTIPTIQDTVYEGDEVFTLYLANPNGGAVRAPNQIATVTIVEDDPVPHLKINDVSAPESTGIMHFTVTATGDSVVPLTVNWAAYNGTAKAPGDFSPTGGSFVIPGITGGIHIVDQISDPANHPKVTIVNDATPELTENFYVRLQLPVPGSAIIDDYEGKGTIVDNDPVTVHGFVFMDLNGNGAFDSGSEYGLSGVQVTITDGGGNHITLTGPTLTDTNGPYNYALIVLLGSDTINVALNTAPANSILSTGSVPFAFTFTTSVINSPDIGFTIPGSDFEAPVGSVGEGGGAYADTVYGGQGNDTLNGGAGDDWLIGGHWLGPLGACNGDPYDAVVRDNAGRRYIDPNLPPPPPPPQIVPAANEEEEPPCPDDDVIHGSDGNDLILGDYGYVTGAGVPVFLGVGGTANDKIYAEAGNDSVYAQGGDDQLMGGTGDDMLDGGDGNDFYPYNGDQVSGADTLVEAPAGGTDTIDLSPTSGWSMTFDLSSVVQQTVTPLLKITLPSGNVFENAIGGSRDDILTGNALDNRLEGRNGNDVLIGGAGTNFLIGGLGSDTYLIDADGLGGLDVLDEVASLATASDVDVIDFFGTTTQGVSLNLGLVGLQLVTGTFNAVITDALGFENLYGGDAVDNLTGNARDNVIWGRAGSDILNGGANTAVGDTLREERGSGFNLTNTTLTVTITGEVDNYLNFENVSLVGDGAANLLDATPFTGTVHLDGRGGSDILRGGSGTNYLTGGAGNDTIFGSAGVDIITESRDGDFTLTNTSLLINLFGGGSETDTYNLSSGAIEQANLAGGAHDNQLNASAFSGFVTLAGGAGNDILIGTGNADTLLGEAGNDSLQGGNGNDTYVFDADVALGTDTIVETPFGAIDTLDFSLTDSAELTINLGDSSVLPFVSTQIVNANLTLTLPANVIENVIGGRRDDVVIGNALANWLQGNDGNDRITGGLSNDVLDGGAGLNPITGQPYEDRVVETRDDDMTLTNSSLSFGGGENDVLLSIETATLTGGISNNTLAAGTFSGPVILDGAAGDDLLIGGLAADVLIGGAGDDTLAGLAGNDTYLFDADTNLGSDTVFEFTGDGTDTFDFAATTLSQVAVDLSSTGLQVVNGNLNLTLSAGNVIENIRGGAMGDTLIGNSLNNLLIGNAGDDRLAGAGADDTLVGGDGDDVYVFDADNLLGTDTLIEEVGAGGSDTLDFSATSTSITVSLGYGGDVAQVVVAGNLQLLLLTCTSIENVIGGSAGDIIFGNELDNRLEGGPGGDLLVGGPGNDTYVFGTDVAIGADILVENADVEGGADTLDFSASTALVVNIDLGNASTQTINGNLSLTLINVPYAPIFSPYAFENVIGGSQSDSIVGNDLNNVLTGGPGDDFIFAGNGDDLLDGGKGDDVLIGGDGQDRIIGGADNDSMFGGRGNDTYVFDADVPLTSGIGNDLVFEAPLEGSDTLDFSGTTTLSITINLGSTAVQAVNANLQLALSADDVIENVLGSARNDSIEGNSLDNRLEGGPGSDTYRFDTDAPLGVDALVEVTGTAGGMDTLDFSATTTQPITLNLSLTTVQIVNVNLRLTLSSGSALENVNGGAANNELVGNALDNVFILLQYGGPLHAVTITGGGGDDTLDFSSFVAAVTVNLGTIGSMQTVASGELQLLLPNLDVEDVIGGSGSDFITGNSLANRLTGGDGNDQLTGGAGDDTYVFGADSSLGTDTIIEDATPAGGIDALDFSGTLTQNVTVDLSNHSLTPQVVNANLSLVLQGTDLIENLTGGGVDNNLTGNTLNNRITANGNNNTLSGATGDDTYVFNLDVITGSISVAEVAGGINTLDFSPTQIQQVILDLSVADPLNLFSNVIGGGADDNITGNSLNNVLSGGGGDDILSGGIGNDTLRGGAGNDSLSGDANDDVLDGGAGNDLLAGGTGDDTYLYDLASAAANQSSLGSDVIVELAGQGNDRILGVAPTGTVNLSSGSAQPYYDGNFDLILTLLLTNPGQVEVSV